MTKTHCGPISHWRRCPLTGQDASMGLGYRIAGRGDRYLPAESHRNLITTSVVLAHDEATGEIETWNSRYTLVNPCAEAPRSKQKPVELDALFPPVVILHGPIVLMSRVLSREQYAAAGDAIMRLRAADNHSHDATIDAVWEAIKGEAPNV